MITLRKLQGLPEATRQRKLVSLLKEGESLLSGVQPGDEEPTLYWKGVVQLVCSALNIPTVRELSARGLWELRQRLLDHLGISQADWDFQSPGDAPAQAHSFPFSVYLEDLRSPFNVGSILRTAEAFGFQKVFASPLCPSPDQPRVKRSAMGCTAGFCSVDGAVLKEQWADRPVFALELGGSSLSQFSFPPGEALVLLGNEELGLSPAALEWADNSGGRVSLPLYGQKASLNVGVAFGILAAYWTQFALDHTVAPKAYL